MSLKICLLVSILICSSFAQASLRPSVRAFNPPVYKQCDAQWRNVILGFGPQTLCQAGCLVTSVTSLAAALGVKIDGKVPIPSTMNNWLKNHGGFVQSVLFVWDSVRPLGVEFIGFAKGSVQIGQYWAQGKYIVLNVNNGGHYVLLTGIVASGYTVMDPASPGKTIYGFNEVVQAGVYNWRK